MASYGRIQAAGAGAEALSMAERLMRNYEEDCGFAKVLERFEQGDFANFATIPVCETPFVFAFGGAKLGLDMVINPTTILKCMRELEERPEAELHGHEISRDVLKYLIFEIRNPAMLLRGSKDGTLVAVTDLMDQFGRPIIVSVALNRQNAHHTVNQITSAYGRNNFPSYLQRQLEYGNVLAVNPGKANRLFREAEVKFPVDEMLIQYDNSIAYSFENVRMVMVEKGASHLYDNSGLPTVLENAIEQSRANVERSQEIGNRKLEMERS